MNKEKVLEGLERMHVTIYSAQSYLKTNEFDRALVMLKNMCLDSKYYSKHIRALRRAAKNTRGRGLNGAKARRVKRKTQKKATTKKSSKSS